MAWQCRSLRCGPSCHPAKPIKRDPYDAVGCVGFCDVSGDREEVRVVDRRDRQGRGDNGKAGAKIAVDQPCTPMPRSAPVMIATLVSPLMGTFRVGGGQRGQS